MRTSAVVVASLLLGIILGAASGYWSAGSSQNVEALLTPGKDSGNNSIKLPEIRVDSLTHNFGIMERGSAKSHSFRVKNVGDAPLIVNVAATSCKCTVGNADNGPIPPGETVDVTLRWEAKTLAGPFRQTATLVTNDPRAPHVELSVEGEVTDVAGLQPQEWLFDKVRAGEVRTDSIYLMSYERDEFKVIDATVEPADGRPYFEVSAHTVEKSELPDEKAKSGIRLDVTLNEKVPLGPLDYSVIVKTDLPEFEQRWIPILGHIVGDISIRGSNWNEQSGQLYLGMIDQAVGREATLRLIVKGPHAKEIEVSALKSAPQHLQVEVGERQEVGDQVHLPIKLAIPPGTVPSNHLGTVQGEPGRVTLRTNHPVSPEISFEVLYAVQQSRTPAPPRGASR